MSKKFNINQLLNPHSKNQGIGNNSDTAGFKIEHIPIENIIPSQFNKYSVEDIAELKASIELYGLQQNLLVRQQPETGKYELISGHRRYRALQELAAEGKAGFERVPCRIIEPIDDLQAELQLIFANATSRRLSDYELTYQTGRVKELLAQLQESGHKFDGRKRDILAELLDMSPSQVHRYESINKNLSPELLQEFKDGKINVTTAYEASRLPEPQQAEVLEEYKAGGTLTPETMKHKQEAGKPYLTASPQERQRRNEKDADMYEAVYQDQQLTPNEADAPKKIKPCPFCGGSANLNREYDKLTNSRWVTCDRCLVSTPGYSGIVAAITAWNKRVRRQP